LATKKREKSGEGAGASPAKKKKTTAKRPAEVPARRAPARRVGPKAAAKPRIRASHAAPSTGPDAATPRRRVISADTGRRRGLEPKPRGPALRKAPLGAPKRAATAIARPPRRTVPPAPAPAPEASNAAREMALALATAGMDKKALGIEILDVTGKVDYADFLVVMTGRSDRHVHAIAMGIEEAMHRRKLSPLSTEGLTSATWVLLDFGDVVVHVFQEEARALYDIEGLWIDAGRVPVPDEERENDPAAPHAPPG
jgi:ribosome-associated protein